ncbi:serine acetyltransferase [Pseudomonas sp. GV085]|uniref:serine acetyltransferase n=1 Tax=Pseudomonas sp. GV085 TaxID=2135756 RepID=UPI000D34141E|nr:serine acetyltransferase [Pseudomonas sp. GV085]
MFQRVVEFLINFKYFRWVTSRLLRLFFVDVPRSVKINGWITTPHGGMGIVIHPNTTIGKNVKIYQQVTVGRADIHNLKPSSDFKGFQIGDDVIICAGAKILTSTEIKVGRGTIIGANSVLTKSTGVNEIWAGIPAKFIKHR